MNMVEKRKAVERDICTAVIDALLEAGFLISVNNGGDTNEINGSTDKAAILATMFQADDDKLFVAHSRGSKLGMVHLVYGNDFGACVVADYTQNLELFIGNGTAVDAKIREYED